MTERVTHYQLLGVNSTAPQQDIKAAYQRLALQWHPDKAWQGHPDKASGAEREFHQLQEAWVVRQLKLLYKFVRALRSSDL